MVRLPKGLINLQFSLKSTKPMDFAWEGAEERCSVPAEKPAIEHCYRCERQLWKGKWLSKRISQRRKHFSFIHKSFRKLFIFPMKTFSLNSKQLFFSRLLFTEAGSVSVLSCFILPPQNVNQALCLGLEVNFQKKKKRCEALLKSCSCCCCRGEGEGREILLFFTCLWWAQGYL